MAQSTSSSCTVLPSLGLEQASRSGKAVVRLLNPTRGANYRLANRRHCVPRRENVADETRQERMLFYSGLLCSSCGMRLGRQATGTMWVVEAWLDVAELFGRYEWNEYVRRVLFAVERSG